MKKIIKTQKRRAVSEVISTMLILAITMVGAVFVSSIINQTMFSTADQTTESDSYASSIRLTAYDSRDSYFISEIVTMNNTFNQSLCTSSCQTNPDFIPSNNGTEFIVIQVRNSNIDPVFVQSISVNNVNHFWDEKTSSKLIDASANDNTGKYPASGKFSIIPWTNDVPLIQRASNEIAPGEEVRLVLKLSENYILDIEMWKPLQIYLNFGGPEPAEFIILSGDTR